MKYNTALTMAIAAMMAGSSAAALAEDGIDVGGTVRANYQYKSYSDASKDKMGDFKFDMLALKFKGEMNGIGLAAEYRFFDGWESLRYAYAYYDFNDQWQGRFGLTNVPFGNPGYISNSFWFGVPYYLGFEDDYDMGATFHYDGGSWKTDIGAFKGAEYSASRNERYSTDLYQGIVNGTEYSNEETNQLNLRQVYVMDYDGGSATIGGSLEWGQIYNGKTGDNGDRYAVALHLDAKYGDWKLQLQAMQYEYDADSPVDANKIAVSAYAWQYEVASKAQIYSVNLAKSFPTSWGSITVYNDFGTLTPDTDDASFDDSLMNVTGMAISAGPTYTYIDFIAGENMYAAGVNDHVGLAQTDSGWDNRININFGYYF
ncbi:hypothetical protein FCL40_07085 [Ferrimonas sediminicola]|uniref:Phosphate-selective porin O and P n=1 Tax=Ferrimonas sediminicola TaxID=2569538 RepID=A0A4U1BFB8_9GAMM|nr:hypothetical protein [Ferrimonas sediminicola]TKB49908.1 hypothetical protein FCL40_07085 [Ferrimonas sediminicola]